MINCRLFKWLIIGLIGLYSVTVQATDNCVSAALNPSAIDPNCQQTTLRGLWWAVPGQLIPPALIEQFQSDAISLEVPGYWPEEKVNLNVDYPRGFITLWTDLTLSGINANGEGLALWPGRQSAAIRIYVDNGRGSWIKAYDNLSVFVEESDHPIQVLPTENIAGLLYNGAAFQLPKLYPGSRVILQLYVNDYRTGGIAQPPQIGLSDTLYRNIMHRWAWHLLFLGACIVIAIFAGSQAYFSSRERPMYLYLVLISVSAGFRLLVTGSLLAYIFPSLTVNHHFYLSWISFLSLLGIFIGAQVFMLPMIFKHYTQLKKVLLFFSLIPLFLVVLIPFLSLHEFLLAGHSLRTFYLVVSFCYAVFVIRQVWLKPKGQRLQLLGVMVILISGSFDAYLYAQNIDPYIELFAVAMFVFIAAQAMYFGWKHILLLRREQSLTLNLKELNGSLEGQIRKRTHDLQSANTRLSRAALTDVLTDLPNRRAFDTDIENETFRAKCNATKLCLAIVDVDWFKTVNDRFGHDFGDKVLQTLADFIRNRLRTSDFVARIGGEEFAIILPSTDISAATVLLNQLCAEVAKVAIDTTKDYHLSISIGCTQWHQDLSISELYKLADQALYKAKNSGRGRVEISY